MKYNLIKVGDKLRFSLKKGKESGKKYYDSRIVEMYENQKVFIMEEPGSPVDVAEKGDLYEFVIFTENENVSCDCTLVRTFRQEIKYLTVVRVVSPVVAAQLRAHPRYRMAIPVRYNVLEDGVNFMDEPAHSREGVVQDISGGGMRFYGNIPYRENTKLRMMVEKQEGSMLAEGVVVRQIQLDEPDGKFKYELRVKFVSTGSSRRKKPRTSCKLPLRFSVLDENDNAFSAEYMDKRVLYEGEVKNISEGGIRFAGYRELKLDTRLYLEVEGKDGILMAEGIVVSILPTSFDGSPYKYENGVKFLSVTNKRGAKLSSLG